MKLTAERQQPLCCQGVQRLITERNFQGYAYVTTHHPRIAISLPRSWRAHRAYSTTSPAQGYLSQPRAMGDLPRRVADGRSHHQHHPPEVRT
jgi:hypothetical protein